MDPTLHRIAVADPAPPDSEPPEIVMDADAILALIEKQSSFEATGANLDRIDLQVHFWRHGAVAVAAAFLVMVLAIGITALVGGEPDRAVDQPPISTTLISSSTTAPPTTAAPPAPTIRWEPVVLAGPRHLYFVHVVSDGEQVVAVSAESDTAAESLWTSTNGRDWELIEQSDLLDAYPFDGVLTAGPDGFIVVGAAAVGSGEAAGYSEVTAVVSDEMRWIAVGRHELDGRVWISDDAASWERADDSALAGGAPLDVVAGGPGFVAVGSFHGYGDGGGEHAAVWVSSDGRTWRLAESETLAAETQLGSVIVDPSDGSLIAFGKHSVWRSNDAEEWTAIHNRSASIWLSQPSPTAAAVWVGDTLVAAGGDNTFSLWTSPDRGVTWDRHDPDDPVFAGQSIDGLVEHRGTLITVGGDMYARINVDSTAPWADPDAPVIWIGGVVE
jgi:hypothetical protein